MSAFPSDMDHDAADSPESEFVGGPIRQNADRVQKANPITYVSEKTPPMLIAHGKQDRLVPFNQSELIYKALVSYEREVIFERLENAGHGGVGFEVTSELVAQCIAFFKRHLVT
jgi:dipeptidyl aminopeptidase/acylaminoacyl peptidase